MIKLFRNLPRRQAGIRKKLLQEGKTTNYFKYAIREILLMVIDKTILCPVRDNILVEKLNTKANPRAFRYEI